MLRLCLDNYDMYIYDRIYGALKVKDKANTTNPLSQAVRGAKKSIMNIKIV